MNNNAVTPASLQWAKNSPAVQDVVPHKGATMCTSLPNCVQGCHVGSLKSAMQEINNPVSWEMKGFLELRTFSGKTGKILDKLEQSDYPISHGQSICITETGKCYKSGHWPLGELPAHYLPARYSAQVSPNPATFYLHMNPA